tara:strand:- start:2081 stop:2476 length:396 start_codon:yes stop_codon:yes gene_type:complete
MEYIRKFIEEDLKFEYGLDGIRTFPWRGITPPFGGGYCIVRPKTETLAHVNSPEDEDEMFIAIAGVAEVFLDGHPHPISRGDIVIIPRGVDHYVRNSADVPFHFYSIWWNGGDVDNYLSYENNTGTNTWKT